MKTYYTKENEVKGQELDSIITLLNHEYPQHEFGIIGLLKHVEGNSIPLGMSAYDDLMYVPFTLAQLNGYISSFGINTLVVKQHHNE